MRPRDFLAVLEDPKLPRYTARSDQAESLRALLVHTFFVDLDFDKRELTLLQRVLPEVELREYVERLAARRLDLDRLAELFPESADREDIVTLTEHAAWGDAKLAHRERDLIERLKAKLGVAHNQSP